MQPEDKPSFFATNYIRFLGGRNTIFTLITLLLLGLVVFTFKEVSFIFHPLSVFMKTVVLPIVLALILFYLLRPVLRMLENFKIPRIWGILIIFLGVVGLITLLIVLVFPFLKSQFQTLIEEFPTYFMQLLTDVDAFLRTSYIGDYYSESNFTIDTLLATLPGNIADTLQNTVTSIITGVTGLISTITGVILSVVIVPFILFYLLKDGEKLPEYFLKLLPPRFRDDTREVFTEADKQLGAYIQGQLIVAFCIGVMVYIGFLIIGMDYALLLGVLAMVTSIVPYIGPAIAITPAAIIALVTSPFMLVKLAIVWTVVQLVEGNLISPQVMGKTLFIHPVTIIFVLLTAGSLFGVVGVILGIPMYALLRVLISHFYRLFKRRYNKHETNLENQYDYTEL
ncbi:AI-2E family transporter [Microbacterium sp. APC 3898]|uniref:AI-2E family transporter n=2 Tax=Planococcus TaxID=1372 RepID=A0ABT7ZIB8_9BACL|nr:MULTISPECIES: AI-2E family transporter [Terrabacteria group]MBF6632857.1 AI-2E family transporter [Planococcus sp. (in: firmicutes)]MBD8014189.1 AI-2E family transporter [Planococcus wigleyi]MDN3426432.1 AI-2E family transporter [Planococcus sp. APC 4016]MDN3438732.1 AI-2E family transporter [Planococcus sp. APC 3900]MDN3498127.1 AI-2E family transporter [Microbacterium sp. APC 3898]